MIDLKLDTVLDRLIEALSDRVVEKVTEKLQLSVALANDQNNEPSVPELYTAKEVCQIMQITRQTLNKWESKGKLKPIRINGTHLRYVRTDVDNLLKKGCVC